MVEKLPSIYENQVSSKDKQIIVQNLTLDSRAVSGETTPNDDIIVADPADRQIGKNR